MVQSGPGLVGGGDKGAVQTGVRTRSGVTNTLTGCCSGSSGGMQENVQILLES